jgi:RNA polymerase-binding transcription factor DksA
MAIGYAICEPKLRLGRRRHDGVCDDCGEPIDAYGAEKLNFPLDDLSPDASSSIEKLRAMWTAQYVQICLECATDREAESKETDSR